MAPYKIFFPIGLFGALCAVGVWFLPNSFALPAPAMFVHGKLVVGVFLWSYIVGFLMTAIPRMTGTAPAQRWEYGLGLGLTAALFVTAWGLDPVPFYTASVLQTLFVIVYGGRRLWVAAKTPPVFFSHVGVAMVLALTGACAHASGHAQLGLHLYHVGAVLLLVLGIGTRFFAFLSGLPSDFENAAPRGLRNLFHLLGVAMAVFLGLAGVGWTPAYLGLSLLAGVYLFGIWRIQRPSARPSALKWAMRLVATVIPLSFLMSYLQPALALAWLHLLFIGGFALVTFAVSTRVTLAHGAYPTDLETRSPALWMMFVFIASSAVVRVVYGVVDTPLKAALLHAGAALWFFALIAWSVAFLPKIFLSGPQAKPSC